MKFGYWLQAALENLVNRRRWRKWHSLERRRRLNRVHAIVEDMAVVIVWVIAIQLYLFQLYVIPSGSMQDTLLIGDKVAVNKLVFGPELIPGGLKQEPLRAIRRGEIIAFVSPDGPPPGVVYSTGQRIAFLLSLGLIDLDRFRKVALEQGQWRSLRPDRSPASLAAIAQLQNQEVEPRLGATPLLVKRAVGHGGDTLRLVDGDLSIRPQGAGQFISEDRFKELSGLVYQQKRDRQLRGRESFYRQRVDSSYYLNPQDALISQRFWHEVLGHYVPPGHVLPLGDNRDNSHDGRWFGLVPERKLIGKIVVRFWPLSRLAVFRE